MDDFLSAAANSVVCNPFPRQKVVNLKAEKSLQVELSKASSNAIQSTINCNTSKCDQQKQTHHAYLGDQADRAAREHCLCR